MKSPTSEEKLILLLLTRLERISVDSYWAHRASGMRGSLLNTLEGMEKEKPVSQNEVNQLIAAAFKILTQATMAKMPRDGFLR